MSRGVVVCCCCSRVRFLRAVENAEKAVRGDANNCIVRASEAEMKEGTTAEEEEEEEDEEEEEEEDVTVTAAATARGGEEGGANAFRLGVVCVGGAECSAKSFRGGVGAGEVEEKTERVVACGGGGGRR